MESPQAPNYGKVYVITSDNLIVLEDVEYDFNFTIKNDGIAPNILLSSESGNYSPNALYTKSGGSVVTASEYKNADSVCTNLIKQAFATSKVIIFAVRRKGGYVDTNYKNITINGVVIPNDGECSGAIDMTYLSNYNTNIKAKQILIDDNPCQFYRESDGTYWDDLKSAFGEIGSQAIVSLRPKQ